MWRTGFIESSCSKKNVCASVVGRLIKITGCSEKVRSTFPTSELYMKHWTLMVPLENSKTSLPIFVTRIRRLKAKEAFTKNKRFSYALLLIKPIWKFFNSYFIRLGFLDGKKGVIICHLDALCDVERYRELQRLEREEQWSTVFKTMP